MRATEEAVKEILIFTTYMLVRSKTGERFIKKGVAHADVPAACVGIG